MSRAITFVFDDAIPVPGEIYAMVGVEHYGALLYQRRRLVERVSEAARAAGFTHRHLLREHEERLALAEELSSQELRVVYLTADVVVPEVARLTVILEKLAYADTDVLIRPEGVGRASVCACLRAHTLASLLRCRTGAQRRDWFTDQPYTLLPPEEGMLGVGGGDELVRLLADTFYTRAFNQIRTARRTVEKRSQDQVKMQREHGFWYQLPPALQRYVVQPFDLQLHPHSASYRMERLGVPDLGILWVHGPDALDERAFEAMLSAVFGWIEERSIKDVSEDAAAEVAEALYITKVEDRRDTLLSLPVGTSVDAWVAAGTRYSGLRELFSHYLEATRQMWARRGVGSELAITHGDLCFSNILYDKRSGLLRFIDPRGATTPEELYSDPYYDLAKLSHSILGGYDFVNSELFEVSLGEDLSLSLSLAGAPTGHRERLFLERVRAAGFELDRLRLCEASLFLSMMPLHAEAPRKLVTFALIAAQILADLETSPESGPGWLDRLLGRG